MSFFFGNRSDDILPDVPSKVSLGEAAAALHPFGSRPGIAFESGFIAKEGIGFAIFKQIKRFIGRGFTLGLPCFPIGRLWTEGMTGQDGIRHPIGPRETFSPPGAYVLASLAVNSLGLLEIYLRTTS